MTKKGKKWLYAKCRVALQAREQKKMKKVPFHGTFSRHGKAQASLALLIWLNENVLKKATIFNYSTERKSAITYEVNEKFL